MNPQLSAHSNAWHRAAGQIAVKIPEVLTEIDEGFALCPMGRVFAQVPEPEAVVFLPVDDFYRMHASSGDYCTTRRTSPRPTAAPPRRGSLAPVM